MVTKAPAVSPESQNMIDRRGFFTGLFSAGMFLASMAIGPKLAEAATVKAVKGNHWNVILPKYLRKRVRVTRSGSLIFIRPRAKSLRNEVIAIIEECDAEQASFMRQMGTPVGTLKLKNGKRVTLRLGDDAYYLAIYKISANRYLLIEVQHYGNANGMLGYGLTKAQLNGMAKLQSLGKRKKYPTSIKANYIPKVLIKALCNGVRKA